MQDFLAREPEAADDEEVNDPGRPVRGCRPFSHTTGEAPTNHDLHELLCTIVRDFVVQETEAADDTDASNPGEPVCG